MAVTATRTVDQIVTQALKLAGVWDVAQNATSAPEEAEYARLVLDSLLKGWQTRGLNLWTRSAASLTLTTAASYTLSPVRPLRILSARLKRGGIETPMIELTRDEYDELPQKTVTGLPTQWYYDRQREAALFYVWPVLATAAGETVEITYEREQEDIADLTDTLDMPIEWVDAVEYGLADRLNDTFGRASQAVIARAQVLRMMAEANDRESSVMFGPERY